jgi:hypothetical protein
MGILGIDPDIQWLITQATETVLTILLVYWWKFEKRESKRRKPRAKRADVQVTVPTVVKVENGDSE